MTAAETVLCAMIDAGKRIGFHRFTTAEVVVASFGACPDVFSMRGYHGIHPDSKRVTVEMSRLRKRGFVRLIECGCWIVTEEGAEHAHALWKALRRRNR